jgi:glycosyltransferase involved in cell wall biosynthesis
MNIAFLSPRYHTNQISLVKYLLRSKNQVTFYVLRIGQSEDHLSLKPTLINLNYFCKIIKIFFKSNNPLFDYRYGLPSINELLKFKSNRFDLIIIRDPINLISLSYFLWAKLIGVKIILYIQKEIYKKKSFKIKEIIERIFLAIFKVECFSPCLGNSKYKKIISKITYLPFCLPVSNYKKKWFLNNKINILTIGKFINRKNHLLLIRALSLIKNKNKFQLTIIGECSSEEHFIYLKKIKKEIKLSGLDINIWINIRPKDIKDFYKEHDLFVLPSVNEPASISNLEAMAYGLPVITTDTNNTSCYTEHGGNGFIVKSNNLENLREKIEFLILNKNKLMQFGKKSISLVKQKYNPNVNYKKYFERKLNI